MKKIILLLLTIVLLSFDNIPTVTASENQYTINQITNLTNSVVSGFNSHHNYNTLAGIPYTYNGVTYTTLNQINASSFSLSEEMKLDIAARVLCGNTGDEWGKSLAQWQADNSAIYNKVATTSLCYAVAYHSLNLQEMVKSNPDKTKITRGVYFTLLQIDFLSTKLEEIPVMCDDQASCPFNDFRLKYGSTYYASTYLLDALTGLYLGIGWLNDTDLINQTYASSLEGKTIDLFQRINALSQRIYGHHSAEVLASNYDPACIGCISNRRILYRAGGMYSLLSLSNLPESGNTKTKTRELVATFFDHDYLYGRDKYEPSGFMQYWGIAMSADDWAPLTQTSLFRTKGNNFLNVFNGAYWPVINGNSQPIYAQDGNGKDLDSYDLTRLKSLGITDNNVKIGCSNPPNANQWFTQTNSGRLIPNGMILSAGLMTAFPQAYFVAENINPASTAQMRSVYGKYLTDLTSPWNIATPDDLVCSQIVFYAQQQTPASAALGVSNFFVAGKLFWDRIKFKPIAPVVTPLPGDFNGDNKVDIYDYNLLITNFGNPYTIFDYNELVGNFGSP